MDKVRIEVEIERDLLDEAERLGVDVQAEVERGLRRRLGRPSALTQEERDAVHRHIQSYNRYVDQNGLFADEWRTF